MFDNQYAIMKLTFVVVKFYRVILLIAELFIRGFLNLLTIRQTKRSCRNR